MHRFRLTHFSSRGGVRNFCEYRNQEGQKGIITISICTPLGFQSNGAQKSLLASGILLKGLIEDFQGTTDVRCISGSIDIYIPEVVVFNKSGELIKTYKIPESIEPIDKIKGWLHTLVGELRTQREAAWQPQNK